MSRTTKIIFTVSILLNLVIIGIAGGLAARFWSGGAMHFAPMAMRINKFSHMLEEVPNQQTRLVLMEKFQQVQSQNREHGRIMRDARRNIRNLASQDPFDGVAYDTEIARILSAKRNIENGYAVLLRDVANALPANERAEILDWLYRDGKKKRKNHK